MTPELAPPPPRELSRLRLVAAADRLAGYLPVCVCGGCAVCDLLAAVDAVEDRPGALYRLLRAIVYPRRCRCSRCALCQAARACQGWVRLGRGLPLDPPKGGRKPVRLVLGGTCSREHLLTRRTLQTRRDRRGHLQQRCLLCESENRQRRARP